MILQNVDEHTLDVEALGAGSKILDVGCRGFGLAKHLASIGCEVWSLDPDPDIVDPAVPGVTFLRQAMISIADERGEVQFVKTQDRSGSFVLEGSTWHGPEVMGVQAVTIEMLMKNYNIGQWDAVKLDCEGSEYSILANWPGPIAKQISFEMHEHTGAARGEATIQAIINHLKSWYEPIKHERTLMHGLPTLNYWDSLFVLRK